MDNKGELILCKICNEYKVSTDYYKGFISRRKCKECWKEHMKARNRINKSQRKYTLSSVKSAVYSANRRAKDMRLPALLTDQGWKETLRDFNGKCALTGGYVSLDHFIPLKWGHGGTYVGNVFPSFLTINNKRGNQNPFNFFEKSESYLLGINKEKWVNLVDYLAEQNGLSIEEFREFVQWCYDNKRSKEQIRKDGNKTSLELWRESREQESSDI